MKTLKNIIQEKLILNKTIKTNKTVNIIDISTNTDFTADEIGKIITLANRDLEDKPVAISNYTYNIFSPEKTYKNTDIYLFYDKNYTSDSQIKTIVIRKLKNLKLQYTYFLYCPFEKYNQRIDGSLSKSLYGCLNEIIESCKINKFYDK